MAGSIAGAYLLANACLSVVQARMIDRLGQSRVLPGVITLWGLALAALIWSVEAGWPVVTAYALAGVAGATFPPLGACVRSRWTYVLSEPDRRQTAFALEAVGDEIVFVGGAMLVPILATTVHPAAALTSALAAGVVGTSILSFQRLTEPPPHPRREHRATDRHLSWRTLAPLTVVSLCLGILLAVAEVATVAFAEQHGSQAYAGPLLALWAAGSLVAGTISGAVAGRRPPLTLLQASVLAMTLTMVPPVFIDSVPLMAVALFAAGFALAPSLIATMTLVAQTVPAARLNEGMAVLQTGLAVGLAPGATLAGIVIDSHGVPLAYALSAVAGLLALAAAFRVRLRQAGVGADV